MLLLLLRQLHRDLERAQQRCKLHLLRSAERQTMPGEMSVWWVSHQPGAGDPLSRGQVIQEVDARLPRQLDRLEKVVRAGNEVLQCESFGRLECGDDWV
jgi:hypothetical protein